MRIVSLVPSSTETLLALGADVVACTRFCEQPELDHVGGTKNPDVEAIVALAPDLVVLDREENRREDADALAAAGLELFVSDVRSVDDASQLVADLAQRIGAEPPVMSVPSASVGERVTAFVPIWRRPWMAIGPRTYGASALAHLGCDVVPGGDGPDYPEVDLDRIADDPPDLVLVPSEPYGFTDDHVAHLAETFASSVVTRIDGQDLFWWGVRTPEALQHLGAVVDDLRARVGRSG